MHDAAILFDVCIALLRQAWKVALAHGKYAEGGGEVEKVLEYQLAQNAERGRCEIGQQT